MNKKRATEIIKLKEQLEDIKAQLEPMRDAEREKLNCMSESAQESDKGQQAELAAMRLEEACDELDTVIAYLESATC